MRVYHQCLLPLVRSHFVPPHQSTSPGDLEVLQRFVDSSRRLLALTGAGISTESGIPDYRSAEVGLYAKNGYRPIDYREFLSTHSTRQRYWARSFLSWKQIVDRQPNEGHIALVELERATKLLSTVTQNVDRLHQKSGLRSVVELHGSLYTVKCIECDYHLPRVAFQEKLAQLNNGLLNSDRSIMHLMSTHYGKLARPDGDVNVESDFVHQFAIPYCAHCGGILKPDVVFFGDNVRRELVEKIYSLVDQCDSLLVLGSSLQVYSSYRFVLHANKNRKPILIINIGPTRADPLPGVVRLDVKIGNTLPLIKVSK